MPEKNGGTNPQYEVSDDEEVEYSSPVKNGGILEAKALVERNKSKLEKLLAQPDIFDCLRRINQGLIRSYDDLELHQNGA